MRWLAAPRCSPPTARLPRRSSPGRHLDPVALVNQTGAPRTSELEVFADWSRTWWARSAAVAAVQLAAAWPAPAGELLAAPRRQPGRHPDECTYATRNQRQQLAAAWPARRRPGRRACCLHLA